MTKQSPHLDAMRGAAALVVFFAHTRVLFFGAEDSLALARNSSTKAAGLALPNYLMPSLGHQAVMVFFVLSGLLVGGSVIRQVGEGTFRFGGYLAARLTRLWVPLVPLLLIGGLVDLVTVHYFPGLAATYTAHRLGAEILLGNVGFLQGLFIPYLGSNVPLWSLAFEWWFYLAFPLVLIAVARSPLRTIAAVAALAAIYFLVGPIGAFYFGLWCLGAIVSVLPRCKLPAPALPIAAVAFLVFNVVVWKLRLFPLVSDAALAACAAALCYLVLHVEGPTPGRLYTATAGALARVSYTLYLAHFPIIFLLAQWLGTSSHPWPVDAAHVAAMVGLLGAVFAVCYVLYLAFEARTERVRALLQAGKSLAVAS